jgi:ABC-type nitrate/sulfonate/bicarbonate transport system substrate-binding protein
MKRVGWLVSLVVAVLLAAACGGGSGGGSDEGLRVGYASDLDPADVVEQPALDEAKAQVTTLTEDSAVVAGLKRGNLNVGNVGLTEAIKASQSGVELKIFYVSQKRFEFVMVSQPEIEGFGQLAGKKIAYHSPGSGTEILQRELVRQYDPALEDKIEWVVLPESPNRASAMLADRIDATSLEYADVLAIQAEDDFNVLGTWEDIEGPTANVVSTVWVANEDYYRDNKEELKAFASELQSEYNAFYEGDKDAWLQVATEELPDIPEERLSKSYDFYREIEMYPEPGEPALTPELWEENDKFFRSIGEYEEPPSKDLVDFEMIKAVATG